MKVVTNETCYEDRKFEVTVNHDDSNERVVISLCNGDCVIYLTKKDNLKLGRAVIKAINHEAKSH